MPCRLPVVPRVFAVAPAAALGCLLGLALISPCAGLAAVPATGTDPKAAAIAAEDPDAEFFTVRIKSLQLLEGVAEASFATVE